MDSKLLPDSQVFSMSRNVMVNSFLVLLSASNFFFWCTPPHCASEFKFDIYTVTRWWSQSISAPLFTLISSWDFLHIPLIMRSYDQFGFCLSCSGNARSADGCLDERIVFLQLVSCAEIREFSHPHSWFHIHVLPLNCSVINWFFLMLFISPSRIQNCLTRYRSYALIQGRIRYPLLTRFQT